MNRGPGDISIANSTYQFSPDCFTIAVYTRLTTRGQHLHLCHGTALGLPEPTFPCTLLLDTPVKLCPTRGSHNQ